MESRNLIIEDAFMGLQYANGSDSQLIFIHHTTNLLGKNLRNPVLATNEQTEIKKMTYMMTKNREDTNVRMDQSDGVARIEGLSIHNKITSTNIFIPPRSPPDMIKCRETTCYLYSWYL
jgi:hypothetical protein